MWDSPNGVEFVKSFNQLLFLYKTTVFSIQVLFDIMFKIRIDREYEHLIKTNLAVHYLIKP
jgi:hypothetical protein